MPWTLHLQSGPNVLLSWRPTSPERSRRRSRSRRRRKSTSSKQDSEEGSEVPEGPQCVLNISNCFQHAWLLPGVLDKNQSKEDSGGTVSKSFLKGPVFVCVSQELASRTATPT